MRARKRKVSRNATKFLDLYHNTFHLWNQRRFFQRKPTLRHYVYGIRAAIKRAEAEKRTPQILITGATDAATLKLAWSTANKRRKHIPQENRVNVEFIDVAPQAVERNKLFAKGKAFPANVQKADARKLPNRLKRRQHDVIVSDMFIQFFNRPDKKKVLKQWNGALRMNGTVLTTMPYDLPLKARRKLKPLAPLEQRLEKLKPRAEELGLDPEKAIVEIKKYKSAEEMFRRAGAGSAFKTVSEIRHACKAAGFKVEFVKAPGDKPLGFLEDPINKWAWLRVKLTKIRDV